LIPRRTGSCRSEKVKGKREKEKERRKEERECWME